MSPYAANSSNMQTLPIFVVAVCKQNKSAQKSWKCASSVIMNVANFNILLEMFNIL